MPKLLLLKKYEVIKPFHLPLGGIDIGRSPVNQICINAPSVSERHARIFTTQTGSSVKDLNSALGTFINDQGITRCELHDNDIILIGSYKFKYQQDMATQNSIEHVKATDLMSRQATEIPPAPELAPNSTSFESQDDADLESSESRAQLLIINGINRDQTIPLIQERTVLGTSLERSLIIEAAADGYLAKPASADKTVEINGTPLLVPTLLTQGDQLVVEGISLFFQQRTESDSV